MQPLALTWREGAEGQGEARGTSASLSYATMLSWVQMTLAATATVCIWVTQELYALLLLYVLPSTSAGGLDPGHLTYLNQF